MTVRMTEKINSSKSLVAYLDILGYSDLVNTEYANICYGVIDASLFRWHNYLETHKHNLGEAVKRHITLQVMSDSFIVVFNEEAALSEEGSENTRQLFLMIFLTLISYLVQDCMRGLKHLFRGAVVRSQYYQQKFDNLDSGTFIFSKALCEAHKLEKNIASVPRILVDKSVLEDLDFSLLCKESRPDRELLRDSDGFYCLNLYSSMFADIALAPILREVAGIVKKGIENKKDIEILRKYIWFANYHNELVQGIIKSEAAIPSLKEIKEDRASMLIEIPKV